MKKKLQSRTHPPEQEVKCRKDHICDCCGHTIKIGDKAILMYTRYGKYDDKDAQIGLSFGRWYYCADARQCEINCENKIENEKRAEQNKETI